MKIFNNNKREEECKTVITVIKNIIQKYKMGFCDEIDYNMIVNAIKQIHKVLENEESVSDTVQVRRVQKYIERKTATLTRW